jgi:hypothetical protein
MTDEVPMPESVSRARRKIQEGPNGKWKSKKQLAKLANEIAVRDWAVNG